VVRAISAQGISVAEYHDIITAAESDPELEERVVTVYRLARNLRGYSMTLFRTAAGAAVLLPIVAAPALAQQSRTDTPAPHAPGAPSPNGEMSDAMVHKVGTALRHISAIRKTYEQRTNTTDNQQQIQDLNNQAQNEMVRAIRDQGLSLEQYQQAIQMAQANPTLRQRLITAAQQSAD
jgi:hypothetical protein